MTAENIKLALEVVNTLAIVIASIVAICGINAWRKEFRGKREIELAEEVLALFYEAKDAIRAIRNPISFQGEGKTRQAEENETPIEKEARDRVYFIYERFEKRQKVFNKLHAKRYQYMARFGRDSSKPFEDLREILIDIQVSANSLARIWSTVGDTPNQGTVEQIKKHESIIQSIGTDDPIDTRVEKVISDIEAICYPIIMGKKKYT